MTDVVQRTDSSIPLDEAALCVECIVLFSVRNKKCPKCGTESGWFLIQKKVEHRQSESPKEKA